MEKKKASGGDIRSFFSSKKRKKNDTSVIDLVQNIVTEIDADVPSSSTPSPSVLTPAVSTSTPSRSVLTPAASTSTPSPSVLTSAASTVQTLLNTLPSDIGNKNSGPAQPLLQHYPKNPAITNVRYTKSFQPSWYRRHNWSIYSIEADKVYCFACIFFGTHNSGHQERLFTKDGFNKWHRAIGDKTRGMDGHAISNDHIHCCSLWENFKTNKVPIQNRLDPKRPELIEKNREYFRILVPVIRYFVIQELAYRSRDEHDKSSNNQGNYMELINITLQTNPTFAKLRDNIKKQCSVNQDYTSKTVFNEFIGIMANQVRERIGQSLKASGMFYLIIDECKDNASHEQLSVCVRFCESEAPEERFLGLIRLSDDYTADGIANQLFPLLAVLTKYATFIGITTDGASVLIGQHNGVVEKLREKYPHIVSIHCAAHRLNLVVGSVVKTVIPNTVAVLKQLHSCFNTIKTADKFSSVQKGRKENDRKMPGWIEIRWGSMFLVADTVSCRFASTLITLAECGKLNDNHSTVCAGLFHKMSNYKFAVEMITFRKILALLQSLSMLFQAPRINWHQACNEIKSVKAALSKMATDEAFANSVISQAKELCEECAIPTDTSNELQVTRGSIRNYMNRSENGSSGMVNDVITIVVKAVKKFMDKRYPDDKMELVKGLDALDPAQPAKYLKFDLLKPLVKRYSDCLGINLSELEMELYKYSASEAGLSLISSNSSPNLMKLVTLRNTIACSSAAAERSFSTMNRVKRPRRATLSDERTSDLTTLAHERELTKALDIEGIIDEYASSQKRNIPL